MLSINSLINKLHHDHPSLVFQSGDDFAWDPANKTISYDKQASHAESSLLHEAAHALLGHTAYSRDIELLRIEREAWEYAVHTLAPTYNISIEDAIVESSLTTYRDWLHKRSTCPNCQLNGIQESTAVYRCVHCHTRWSVNEARTCRLRRAIIQPNKITP
jgi:DnaJ-class molecular chaperone